MSYVHCLMCSNTPHAPLERGLLDDKLDFFASGYGLADAFG